MEIKKRLLQQTQNVVASMLTMTACLMVDGIWDEIPSSCLAIMDERELSIKSATCCDGLAFYIVDTRTGKVSIFGRLSHQCQSTSQG